jgi:NAD(P)-dependent dehydrogenase (short-subunit alcohol dehydrogenase family)
VKQDLAGRVALVTGSTRGIGRAIAVGLAARGARVMINGIEVDEGTALAHELGGGFSDVDVGSSDGPRRLLAATRASIGAPDILVLCAAIEILETWDKVTADAMRRQLDVNIVATVGLLQEAVPAMIERGWGRILAIGSVQERRPSPIHFVYAGTKSAQSNMIRSLARTLGARGITANVLQPGAIETQRNARQLGDPAYRKMVLDRIPVARFGTPADCAALAVLLCSDDGAYLTGAELAVDGGLGL